MPEPRNVCSLAFWNLLFDQRIQPLGLATFSLLLSGCDLPPSVSLEDQAFWLGPLVQLLLEILVCLHAPDNEELTRLQLSYPTAKRQ